MWESNQPNKLYQKHTLKTVPQLDACKRFKINMFALYKHDSINFFKNFSILMLISGKFRRDLGQDFNIFVLK